MLAHPRRRSELINLLSLLVHRFQRGGEVEGVEEVEEVKVDEVDEVVEVDVG